MNNIFMIKDCYGCGMCATICPKNIIEIKLNNNGFYQPCIVNIDKCINCGLCLDVCSFIDTKIKSEHVNDILAYAAWSNDETIRKNCSSGGVAFELGRYLIDLGYKVCAVRYNAKLGRAEHYIASSIKDLLPSIGSKYIQSYTLDGFKQLNRKEKFLITGTPCQIDSMRRYIRKMKIEDHFILMDFFCHGVPSMLMWNKYVDKVRSKIGDYTSVSWRNKQTGWHDSWKIEFDMEEPLTDYNCFTDKDLLNEKKQKLKYESWRSKGDLFYKMFLGNSCLGKACYKCKFKKDRSAADIRIGDLWGDTYNDNQEGVNGVLCFTSEGIKLINSISNLHLISHSKDTIMEGQMKESARRTFNNNVIMCLLKTKASISFIASVDWFFYTVLNLKKKICHKLSKYLNNDKKE